MELKDMIGRNFTIEELKNIMPDTLNEHIYFKDNGDGTYKIMIKE